VRSPIGRFVTAAVVVLVTMIAVTASIAEPTSDAAGAAQRSRPETSWPIAGSDADVLAFWTPARIAAAPPIQTPVSTSERPRRWAPPAGRGRVVAGTDGDSASLPAVGAAPKDYAYPFPFTRRGLEVQLDGVFPYRTIGRLYVVVKGGYGWCSAASVVSRPLRVVMTAGHCLVEAGEWVTRALFMPARRNQRNPYGAFAARQLWSLSGWSDYGDLSYDVGAFTVGRNALGQDIQRVVGALGFGWNAPTNQHWDVFGYPATGGFSGEAMQVCEASYAASDFPGTGAPTVGIGCDMTPGSSGGPWILALRSGNYLNGVNSYSRSDQPNAMYAAYFDNSIESLRCAAATGNPSATSC
jgi:V8-like Glu-specific endopeptidase